MARIEERRIGDGVSMMFKNGDIVEIDCPICGMTMDYKMRKEAFYGECKNCRTRMYTNPLQLERVLREQQRVAKKEVRNHAGKRKATA